MNLAESETEKPFDAEQFVYVMIPAPIQPIDRGELFEDKIDAALAPADLGSVSGGGSSLSDPDPNGNRTIEFCGIDIDTNDRDSVLAVLRVLLRDLGVPLHTELHYTKSGCKLLDTFLGHDWFVGQTRTFLHPGFDI